MRLRTHENARNSSKFSFVCVCHLLSTGGFLTDDAPKDGRISVLVAFALRWRRVISLSTAARTKSVRLSPSERETEIRSNVPARNGASMRSLHCFLRAKTPPIEYDLLTIRHMRYKVNGRPKWPEFNNCPKARMVKEVQGYRCEICPACREEIIPCERSEVLRIAPVGLSTLRAVDLLVGLTGQRDRRGTPPPFRRDGFVQNGPGW